MFGQSEQKSYLCTNRTRHASRRPANQGGAFFLLGNALITQKDKMPVSMIGASSFVSLQRTSGRFSFNFEAKTTKKT